MPDRGGHDDSGGDFFRWSSSDFVDDSTRCARSECQSGDVPDDRGSIGVGCGGSRRMIRGRSGRRWMKDVAVVIDVECETAGAFASWVGVA